MTEAAASIERGAPRAEWVHRSASGIEIGGEAPTGIALSAPKAFLAAVRLAWGLRETFWVVVAKDFKARYRAQSLGLFWSLAHPLVMMLTLTAAFRWVLRVQIENFPVFYLIGAVFWQLFANVLNGSTLSMLENGGLIKHTTFPRFLFPVSTVFSNLIPFAMEMLLVFAFFPVFPDAYNLNGSLFLLPLVVGVLVVLLVGAALVTSSLNARYRDVMYMVSSVLTVGFWATPILYSTAMAPEWLRPILHLNPIGCAIESARGIIMSGELPPLSYLATGIVEATVMLVIGALVFRRQNRSIADYV